MIFSYHYGENPTDAQRLTGALNNCQRAWDPKRCLLTFDLSV